MKIPSMVFGDFIFAGPAVGKLEHVNPGTIGWKMRPAKGILKITVAKHIVQTFVTLKHILLIIF